MLLHKVVHNLLVLDGSADSQSYSLQNVWVVLDVLDGSRWGFFVFKELNILKS